MIPKGKIIVSRNIKALKKTWGVPVTYYRYITKTSVNYTTGVQTLSWDTYSIRKAVKLPKNTSGLERLASLIQSINPSIAKIKLDVDDTELIIEAKDFPSTYRVDSEPELQDKIVIDTEVYQVMKAYKYADTAYYFVLKHIVGMRPFQLLEQIAQSEIEVSDDTASA